MLNVRLKSQIKDEIKILGLRDECGEVHLHCEATNLNVT